MQPARRQTKHLSLEQQQPKATTPKPRTGNVVTIRIKDLGRLFNHRYGITLPDDAAGEADAVLMLAHLAAGIDPDKRMNHFLDLRCPWMSATDRDQAKANAAMTRTTWTADQLAVLVGLTMSERTRLNITTIGAIDCDASAREVIRKEKQKQRQREYRRAKRERSKQRPSISDRAFALYRAVPERGWRAVKHICVDLAGSAEFTGLSALKGAVHAALKEAEARSLVKVRQDMGPRGASHNDGGKENPVTQLSAVNAKFRPSETRVCSANQSAANAKFDGQRRSEKTVCSANEALQTQKSDGQKARLQQSSYRSKRPADDTRRCGGSAWLRRAAQGRAFHSPSQSPPEAVRPIGARFFRGLR